MIQAIVELNALIEIKLILNHHTIIDSILLSVKRK